jgi:iron complex outermembrane receptor protein
MIMNLKRTLFAASSIASLTLVLGGAPAFAQASKSDKSNDGLEEIIVTAQRRVENAQDVPIAMSVFSAESLENRGVSNPQDLQETVPNLSIGEQTNLGGAAKVTLRGVGSENYGPGGDPGVPIHINGHYTQSTAYIFRDMLDVQRVEVQRGPQGTLYGRNAVGGNVNIITRRPTENFEGSVGLEAGNYNRYMAQGVVSGPISSGIRARLVAARAKRDGYVEELGVGKDRDSVDYVSVRGALEVDLAENLQTYINAYYFRDKGNNYTRRIDRDPNNLANTEPFKIRSNTPNENDDRSKGASIDFTWDLGGVQFKSLSAYDRTRSSGLYDLDGNAVRLASFGVGISTNVLTQEFELLSDGDGPLKWVLGAFYFKEKSRELRTNNIDRFDTDGDGLTGLQNDLDQPLVVQYSKTRNYAKSWAVFGQADYDASDKFQLVAGLRYTHDNKKYFSGADTVLSDGSTRRVPTGGGRFSTFPLLNQVFFDNLAGKSWSEVTWKLGTNYHVNEDALLYASYSRGYKAGGFAARQGSSYNPETVDAFEVGLKGQWAENRVQTNLSLFYYDYKDKQELQFFPPNAQFPNGGLQLINATNATSYGAELEIQAKVTKAFRIDTSLSYLNATYGKFIVRDVQFPALGFQDLAGNKLPLAPEMKFNFGAQYNVPLGGNSGELMFRADYSWTGEQFGNALNRDGRNLPATGDQIPEYSLINGRIQWTSSNEKMQVALFVRNLLDKYAISNSFVNGLNEVVQSNLKPRTFGLKINYNF